MAKRTLRQMAEALYDHPDVVDAVVADAEKHGNVAKIESGELVLPSQQDAIGWHERNIQQTIIQSREDAMEQRIAALEGLLAKATGKEG